MKVKAIQATVESCEDSRPMARVQVELAGGQVVEFLIHESLAYTNTINVEIDGDLLQDDPSLRINLNDNLIHDSTRNDNAVVSPRRPDVAASDRPEG